MGVISGGYLYGVGMVFLQGFSKVWVGLGGGN